VPDRLYLDNAATSFPKPPSVYDAMLRYARDVGASPGRGQYAESREGARLIRVCRERLCAFLDAESADHIVFTLNTSDALNLAIKGVVRGERLRKGPSTPIRLVTTAMDHNSVLRPYAALAEEGAEVMHVPADPSTGLVDLVALQSALSHPATLLAINWVSNVSGTIQPITEMTAIAHAARTPVLFDVAQGLGHVPFSARACGADLIAFPGHKGLLGPQGTGGLYVKPSFVDHLATTREGGTGSISELDAQPTTMPERFEAGSHNTIGIVGLTEGVRWLQDQGIDSIRAHELGLIETMLAGLRDPALASFTLLGPTDPALRVGTFSLLHDTLTPGELAALLEQHFGILARAGIHCAPRAHMSLGSLDPTRSRPGGPGWGALRISFGPFVTGADVRRVLAALAEIAADSASFTPLVPLPTSF
jgi:cysteine desulfurase / selenocysteine lyase